MVYQSPDCYMENVNGRVNTETLKSFLLLNTIEKFPPMEGLVPGLHQMTKFSNTLVLHLTFHKIYI